MRRMTQCFESVAVALAVALLSGVATAQTYQYVATQTTLGYISPGTNIVNCTFAHDNPNIFYAFQWSVIVPSGWTVISATGGGFSSWDIYHEPGGPEAGWAFEVPYYALSPNGMPSQNPMSFSFKVAVPSGQSGTCQMIGKATYYFDGMYDLEHTLATPNPLEINYRMQTLQIVSDYGTPSPPVGLYTNVYGTALSPSIDASVYVGPTQYVCTGWSLTGQSPVSGTTNAFTMTHTADAALTWNWVLFNIAPQQTALASMTVVRKSATSIPSAYLLATMSDPDGDALTLLKVDEESLCGATLQIVGDHVVYTPPPGTSGMQDSFSYTVTDSHGASLDASADVRVLPGATLIRVF